MDDYPPTLELREADLSAIKGWQVGKKYKLELEVEQISVSKGYDGTSPLTARFKVISAKTEDEDGKPGKSSVITTLKKMQDYPK